MCKSSTTTIGSATAVLRLRSPEEEESTRDRDRRPGYGVVPEVTRVGIVVTVCAVQLVLLRGARLMAQGGPHVAEPGVVRLRAGGALPLGLQQRVPDQRDVPGRRVELQRHDAPPVRLDAERSDAEDHARGVQPGAQQKRQQLAEVVDLG